MCIRDRIEHGRRLRENNLEQRMRIREVCGEGSKRVTELVAQCKLEEEAFEAALAERRREIMEANRQEVQKVRAETDNAVIDASKQYALQQRRSIVHAWNMRRRNVHELKPRNSFIMSPWKKPGIVIRNKGDLAWSKNTSMMMSSWLGWTLQQKRT